MKHILSNTVYVKQLEISKYVTASFEDCIFKCSSGTNDLAATSKSFELYIRDLLNSRKLVFIVYKYSYPVPVHQLLLFSQI